jgi:hypothetical protein
MDLPSPETIGTLLISFDRPEREIAQHVKAKKSQSEIRREKAPIRKMG